MKFVGLLGLIMFVVPNALGARFPFKEIVVDDLFERELKDLRSVPEPSVPDPEEGEVVQDDDICHNENNAIPLCMGVAKLNERRIISASFTLHFLQTMCRDQVLIRGCLRDKLAEADCQNSPEIKALFEKSFSYCDGQHIPLAVQIFLEANYNASFDRNCMVILMKQTKFCDQTNKPNQRWWRTSAEWVDLTQRELDWSVDCLSESDMNEFVPECNLTRKQALGVVVASLQVYYSFGINGYVYFERFMRVDTE